MPNVRGFQITIAKNIIMLSKKAKSTWFIVVLNEMYLNNFNQAKNTMKANMKLY